MKNNSLSQRSGNAEVRQGISRQALDMRRWRAANPEKAKRMRREQMRRAYAKNPEKYKARALKWREDHPERYAAMERKKRKKRLHLFRAYYLNKLHTDPNFKIASTLRSRFRKVIKRGAKIASAIELLGCSVEDFWIYLESKFEAGMTRENMGKVWHIDHIIPCAIFDLTKPEHQRRCFHFSNLQPLFAKDNLSKGKKITQETNYANKT